MTDPSAASAATVNGTKNKKKTRGKGKRHTATTASNGLAPSSSASSIESQHPSSQSPSRSLHVPPSSNANASQPLRRRNVTSSSTASNDSTHSAASIMSAAATGTDFASVNLNTYNAVHPHPSAQPDSPTAIIALDDAGDDLDDAESAKLVSQRQQRGRPDSSVALSPATSSDAADASTPPLVEDEVDDLNLLSDQPRGKPSYLTAWWTSEKLPVYSFDQVPHYLQDNPCIRTHYRAGYTYAQAWKSMFFLHNEFGNIWTHGLGLLAFLGLIASTHLFLPAQQAMWSDHLVFVVYLLSACACFLFSTCFHTHYCNGRSAYVLFGCLDYAGISILICGSSVIVTYYTHYCDSFLRTFYLVALISVSFVGIIGPMFPIWPTARFRVWRTLIYIGSGVLSGLPVIHFLIVSGIPKGIPWWALHGWLLMGATYIGGAVIYATKIPERWFPGCFDIFGHSHQWWHICVVMAASIHLYSAIDLMTWRTQQGCPVSA
ncbi:hemolysin-III related-domain-containing protein [Catenaria anguillulae PL171]|uniref:Hemolysin-III related-domain-containing protein n=1 Tax=Catenaria anguillulae PL171 TaxID=765915 RepID=A0A1Y2HK71_9FUNG|nr:hemolysin-III related-domain-containing protein [Catenaria anguillulae PL171]